jgi:hypothetical protein
MSYKKDRYRFHQFYQGEGGGVGFIPVQRITENIFQIKALKIVTLAMDFIGATKEIRKQIETEWIEIIPRLNNVTALSVRHRVNQEYFEAICKMKSLEKLHFWTTNIESLDSIVKLKKLSSLGISSFSRLSDISPVLGLKKLTHLSIDNSFKIENYEVIGGLKDLVGLALSGDFTSPRNLRLKSLKPFRTLKKLKHLDLSFTSVIDKSYDCILDMTSLQRFDTTAQIPQLLREKIKANHKTLKAGFFTDWDYGNKRFYHGKEW